MIFRPILDAEMALLSRSVQTWYKHFQAAPDLRASETLCGAAIDLFNQGHRTQEELASILIERYPGLAATLVTSSTAITIH
ncbi:MULTISPECIES: hypothetical protein [unclassified Rhizobium]|uniref:hypothetical protein n=1 Tax=unclassified Rhizobium TaxID=2613769 RepID=UPI00161B4F34|nr:MULTISPECIES: hypothetical protein [unclassified Rhizobium]MBB3317671.1 hypothetical protein [Rhizobium sp. BK181]MBB3544572.1 hypothetical protein [Rhizobium sp. BK399]MCS3741595.1 hypothetical protein [Rhizobium sp. BK661]MCS4093681.1 hypothetical protein [Rhizobium sp. BK176]